MGNIGRLFQAFVAPAIFFSATALLILSINVRLMGIVSRLRQFVHAKHDAAKGGRLQEAEACTSQIQTIEQRAEMIRRAFLFSLLALVGTGEECPSGSVLVWSLWPFGLRKKSKGIRICQNPQDASSSSAVRLRRRAWGLSSTGNWLLFLPRRCRNLRARMTA